MEKTEALEKEGLEFLDKFKKRMKAVAEETIGEIYINLMPHIETDSWTNYRNDLREALSHEYSKGDWLREEQLWAREFRAKIVKEHREALLDGLNKDLLKQIEDLQIQLKLSYERRY